MKESDRSRTSSVHADLPIFCPHNFIPVALQSGKSSDGDGVDSEARGRRDSSARKHGAAGGGEPADHHGESYEDIIWQPALETLTRCGVVCRVSSEPASNQRDVVLFQQRALKAEGTISRLKQELKASQVSFSPQNESVACTRMFQLLANELHVES